MNKAQPIWLEGRETEMNLTAVFRARFNAGKNRQYRLRITGSTLYRVDLNGRFAHYGPARAPHGHARVDDIPLSGFVRPGENQVLIEAAGYNCKSYYTLDAPSFVCAEILEDGCPVAWTGENGDFLGWECIRRKQKVLRYSFQRPFSEIWEPGLEDIPHPVAGSSFKGILLEREVPCPLFHVRDMALVLGRGTGTRKQEEVQYIDHGFLYPSPALTAFPMEEIPDKPLFHVQEYDFRMKAPDENPLLSEGEFLLLDFGLNNTGFILTGFSAFADSEVYLMFDEKIWEDGMHFPEAHCNNVVKYILEKGMATTLQTFEAYTFRYLMVFVRKGRVRLDRAALVEYSYPLYENTRIEYGDTDICTIFDAAVETYRQNTLDIFMDCPGRERAGWLCDSYFTAQSSRFFSGDGRVEKVMLENFLLVDRFPGIPEGMLPMCYPADHLDGNFIPQWAMWYVIQLEDFLKRDARADIGMYKALCLSLLSYLEQFENSDGLLENLEKWNFVEWSDANKWVQNVNYPTNMLYARVLSLAGEWFGVPSMGEKAARIRREILRQSFDGTFFVDNALREKGILVPTGNRSEICQYYAFFFGVADEKEEVFQGLKKTLLEVFGPERKKNGILPEVAYANAFVGNYLRMELGYNQSENQV
ncbi:MAG: hypothetical protein R6W96_08375 [Clostridia bacterium]